MRTRPLVLAVLLCSVTLPVLAQDKWNQAYYDKEGVRPVDILMIRNVHNEQAKVLVNAVTKATK